MNQRSLSCLLTVLLTAVLLSTHASAATVEQAMGFEIGGIWRIGAPNQAEYAQQVTSPKKAGNYAAKWSRHNYYPTLGAVTDQADWSAYDVISFWVYSEVVTNEEICLAIHSDSDNGAQEWMDFFHTSFRVDWTGWRKFTIPFAIFEEYQSVAGWNKIDGVFFYTKIFNRQPNPYTVLYLDDIQVCGIPSVDLTGDCQVTIPDFVAFASQWLADDCSPNDWCNGADYDQSSAVDMEDLILLSQRWLEPAGN